MSKSKALPLTIRALSRWPTDTLRPEVQFKDVILRRAKRRAADPKTNNAVELEQANALFSLLENRYKTKYGLTTKMTAPASNPKYYTNLVAELDAATSRSRLGSWLNKWKGFLRFS